MADNPHPVRRAVRYVALAGAVVVTAGVAWTLGPGASWVLGHLDGVHGLKGKELADALDAVRGRAFAVGTGLAALVAVYYTAERDGLWHGYVTMGVKDDGSPDRRHRRGKNEAEVTRKVRELEAKRDAGKVDRPGRAPTVEAWMTTYLDDIAGRELQPNTLQSYWSDTRNWIIPNLGKHRLDRLLPEHLDKLYAQMLKAGKKPSHVLKVHRILSRALEIAVRREKVGRNVAKLIDAPGADESEIEPLTQAEARRILTAAEAWRNGARWTVALALGLRQGESIGLRWKYVDLDGGTVRVWWQLSRLKWHHGCDDVKACTAGKHRLACPKRCPKAKRPSGRPHKCIPADDERLCPKDCDRHASTCPDRTGGGLVFRKPKGKSKRTIPLPAD